MIEPIVIKVVDKVPIVVSGPQYVVCDNSDYTVVWQLDEEWAQFESRTMQVNYKEGTYERVLFTGDACALPAIPVKDWFYIGLFAGDIHTTRPAKLFANRAITTDCGEERDPTPDGYAQAIKALDAKLDKNQGAENAGKALVVSDDGGVVPGEVQGGGSLPAMSSDTKGKMLTNDGENAEWGDVPKEVMIVNFTEDGDGNWSADKNWDDVASFIDNGGWVYALANNTYLPLSAYIPNMTMGFRSTAGDLTITILWEQGKGPEVIEYRLPAVNYTEQTLTADQQAQARKNIGAGTSSFSGSYNDLEDKPDAYTLPVASPTQLGGVKPVAKTDAMTRGVGVDNNGGLYTEPAAWYVTIKQTSADNNTATANKTPQEIFAAYQAGYNIYANIIVNPNVNTTEVAIAPIVFGSVEGGTILFSTVRSMRLLKDGAVAFYAMFADGGWVVSRFELAKKDDIPTALPNPNALTIKVGDTTTTYDGSAAKTVEVESGNVTDEQVSGAVSTWLTAHPEATTTVQDGSVSAKKLEGYHVVCRDVPWTLFLDGYKTTTTVSSEEPGCAIYCVKLESGKTYCISNLPYPKNTNEFVTDPSINYFGYYFGYSTLPDVDANVASNRDRLYGYFVTGLLNTFMIGAINRGYIEFAISGDMPGGSAPYYFTVKQDCFLLRASTKPATGQRINNLPVAEVLPGMSDIGYGPSGQAWSTFKKDLGSSYAGDKGYVQQIFASKVATAEKQRAYAAMSRDVPRDRTLNIQFIGDSITYAASNAGLQNSFVKYVSMNLQAQQLRLCQSGISVTTGGGSYDWNGKPNSSADYNAEMSGYSGLVQKLAEYKSNLSLSVWSDSVDIVVVELGTNDHWEQSALGAQTDLTADTNFYGAVEKTLTLLEETFPHAQVLWLLPFKNQRWKTSTIKLVDYLIALKVICQMHTRCWVLDLTDKWFLDYDDTDLRSSFFIDGVHITGAAHKCVAESMIDKIREIVSVCGIRQIETVHTTDANDSVYGSSST